jgi:CRISPR-associated protein Csb2
LRLFQGLTAAAAARWNERIALEYAVPALGWLERQRRPELIAADGAASGNPYRLYVPDNVGDKVAKAWVAGREADMSENRTEKDVRPTHLSGDTVHYLFPLAEGDTEAKQYLEVLKAAARSVTHLGWGIDMVVADADVISEADAAKLPGHRWRVVPSGGVPLRVPKAGTLANLMEKHAAFLGRLTPAGFKPVPPLSCFDVVRYHTPTVGLPMPRCPIVAFELLRTIESQEADPGRSRFRPFHHVRAVGRVAGLVRRAVADAAERLGWTAETIASRVLGHGGGKSGQATTDDRLQFLPVPTISPVGVAGIRRVLIVGPPGLDLAPLRRQLTGRDLVDQDNQQPVATLGGLALTDPLLTRRFVGESTTWSTVTPVVLPGFDDPKRWRGKLKARPTAEEQRRLLERLGDRTVGLIWKAFLQAGWTPDALAGAEAEYRSVGWFPGLDLANAYADKRLAYPRYHVRVRFPRPVRGPIAVGAGRYRGFGLMAIDS